MNKATGWLAALVRVMNLKLWFFRPRDKMLVSVGLVKKCLQYGHSFRLAGVWLKCQNLRLACAVNRFCSSRVFKKHSWFSIIPGKHPPIHFFLFSKLQCPSAFGNAVATDSNNANTSPYPPDDIIYIYMIICIIYIYIYTTACATC